MASENRIIKTYMSFGVPVDPSNVKTLVDLDLSYALASTLADWTDTRNLNEGLATPSEFTANNEIAFKMRKQARWSDGTAITALQVVRSFAHAKKMHGEDLKSLFEVIDRIEAKDDSEVVFHLNRSMASSNLFHKLTEPMYGVLYVRDDGSVDLSKTSGSYFLRSETTEELTLAQNPYWYNHVEKMADSIIIRQPKKHNVKEDDDDFSSDPWPNLVAMSSLMTKKITDLYQSEHFSVWNRNLDRLFFLSPSQKLATSQGRQFFQALNQKLDREKILAGLSGYHLSQQFFPPGYPIFDTEFKPITAKIEVPDAFKHRPLELLTAAGRVAGKLKHNLTEAIQALTGLAPKFRVVPLNDFAKEIAEGHFDILVATLPVNDPNIEGAVSFFFGFTPPLIPNSGSGNGDFKSRIAHARTFEEEKRNTEYRSVFTKSTQDGCVLPLFHFSSVVVARDGIDLSKVPTSDESVSFSKVRFK